jgi:hypothetical protein
MKFILVQCANDDPTKQAARDAGWKEFRATCAEIAVDFFFWAPDVAHAKRHVRRMRPGATFSDELSGSDLWAIHHGGLTQ